MNDHTHQVDIIARPELPYRCWCGARWDSKNDRWVEPKSPEGKARRETWMNRETAE